MGNVKNDGKFDVKNEVGNCVKIFRKKSEVLKIYVKNDLKNNASNDVKMM